MRKANYAGVNAAAFTLFNRDLSIDFDKTVQHCRWLLNNGCNGLAILGTTAETNSLSIDEREMLLERMVDEAIPAEKLLPGTSTCDIPGTVRLTQHAERAGCKGVLLLPPFYYKSPTLAGLLAFYSEVIERAGGDINIYLYHFPQQSTVSITVELIENLLRRYPGKVKGIKDSSGDGLNTKRYIDLFSAEGFEVYSGADADFQAMLRIGAAGCITAMTNITSALAAQVYAGYTSDSATLAQRKIAALRKAVALGDTVPAVKMLASYIRRDPQWEIVRPPLVPLSEEIKGEIISSYKQLTI